jgi:hypothetical protein
MHTPVFGLELRKCCEAEEGNSCARPQKYRGGPEGPSRTECGRNGKSNNRFNVETYRVYIYDRKFFLNPVGILRLKALLDFEYREYQEKLRTQSLISVVRNVCVQ